MGRPVRYFSVSQRIIVLSTGRVLAHQVRWARKVLERARGLLGRPPLAPGEALVIDNSAQVHTVGMRYSIDVVFCASDWAVLHVVRSMRPMRITRWVRQCRYVIELPAGAAGGDVRAGERVVRRGVKDEHGPTS